MRHSRGVALATALMLLSLVLVIGLALASSSMLSLNLARQTYLDTRAGMLARSGVNELVARLLKAEAAQEIQLFNPRPLDLREQFPGRTELVPGCWISFDPAEPGFSTDNLLGEGKAAGWLDRGRTSASVPPFTLELILHARMGGFERSYRALVRRTWPYAVYSGGGPVLLSGDPEVNHDPAKGSHVTGRIFSAVRPDIDWRYNERDLTPRAALFAMLTSGLQPERDYNIPLDVGPASMRTDTHTPIGDPNPARGADVPTKYLIRTLPTEGPSTVVRTKGNSVVGSLDYTDVQRRRDRQVRVSEGNSFEGQVRFRELPLRRNPLSNLQPGTGEGYAAWSPPARCFKIQGVYKPNTPEERFVPDHVVVPWPPPPLQIYPNEPKKTWVLYGQHRLAGTPTTPSYYVVDGNLVNRIVGHGLSAVPEGGFVDGYIPVDEYGFELELEDCVLHIKGDLDLCDISGRDPTIKGISGNGATIIVEGGLAITGASIRAGDRGMVIYAHNIALAGSGDFAGLLVASSGISVVPQAGKRIKIRGGIVTSGSGYNVEGKPGVALHNVDVVHDPRYLKSLSMCGDYILTAWESL